MCKFINLSVFVLIALFNTKVHSDKTFTLNPSETKSLTSPWALNATCTIQKSNKSKSKIRLSVVKNNCSVNGKTLRPGQATSVTIRQNTSISVSAEAGTQINLENKSNEELQAFCS